MNLSINLNEVMLTRGCLVVSTYFPWPRYGLWLILSVPESRWRLVPFGERRIVGTRRSDEQEPTNQRLDYESRIGKIATKYTYLVSNSMLETNKLKSVTNIFKSLYWDITHACSYLRGLQRE